MACSFVNETLNTHDKERCQAVFRVISTYLHCVSFGVGRIWLLFLLKAKKLYTLLLKFFLPTHYINTVPMNVAVESCINLLLCFADFFR